MPKLAWLKRPSGGCAGAGTHLCRATGRGRSWIDLAPGRPSPRSRGAARGAVVPFYYLVAGFTRMLNHAGMGRGKQGNELLLAERPVQKAADQRKKAAAADAVLQQPAAEPRAQGPVLARRSATPLLASDRLCIDDALARSSSRRRMPARQAACSGRPLTSLFMQQAEQRSKTLRFSMQCLLLEKRAQVK